jgi:hypothetical protein
MRARNGRSYVFRSEKDVLLSSAFETGANPPCKNLESSLKNRRSRSKRPQTVDTLLKGWKIAIQNTLKFRKLHCKTRVIEAFFEENRSN